MVVVLLPDDPRHGTTAGYQAEVRSGTPTCVACKRAWNRYHTRRKMAGAAPKKVPALGAARRVNALRALGWTLDEIAHKAGLSGRRAMHEVVYKGEHGGTITRRTHERIDAVYQAMSMTPPPDTKLARVVRGHARRFGWAPPLAWDDIDRDERPRGVKVA